MILTILLGLKLLVGIVLFVLVICYEDILRRLSEHKLDEKDIGTLVKEHMANGNVRVVGSVFSKRPLGIFPRKLRYEEVFEGKMDSKLESMFGQQDRVKLSI